MAVPSALPLATAGRLYLKEALGLADQQEVAVAIQRRACAVALWLRNRLPRGRSE